MVGMATRMWLGEGNGAAPVLGESRARVLAALQDSAVPLGVADVAGRLGLHANTARFHLDGLVESGLVDRATEDRTQPGRPRALYVARPGTGRAGQRSYRLLAEILASYIAADDPHPEQAATRAGRVWGRYLADRPAPFSRPDADAATVALAGKLDEIGFAPEVVTAPRQRRILLHNCPFREAAEEHRDVVCSIHLGLMQGVLSELGAPVDADRLVPFVEPSLCVAHLTSRKSSQRARSARR